MDLVDGLRAFVATAQTGSFTGAADQLGISNRLTSKYVAQLEARLGVRLFQRTTRKVGLTPSGEELMARAPAMLDELDALLAEAAEGSQGLSGVVRISAPVTFGEVYISDMLARFARANPGIAIDLRLTDSFVDLASDGIDLAFRIGRSDMLSLKARRLGMVANLVAASPEYVSRRGAPETPEDLSGHTCIVDTNRRTPRRWTFTRDGTTVAADIRGPFRVNSARAAVRLAADGAGIVYGPRFAMRAEITSGELVALMPDYTGEHGPISAVYLEGRTLPRKVRALVDFAVEDMRVSDVL